jgi:DNA polymerase III epsilon subunit-like protein
MRHDWRATFITCETTGHDPERDRLVSYGVTVWSLELGKGPVTAGSLADLELIATGAHFLNFVLQDAIVIGCKPDYALAFIQNELGSFRLPELKTKQRIDLCSLAAPLLVMGHVTSISLDALADYFGVSDRASKLDTMIEVWEGLLAAYLLKVEP